MKKIFLLAVISFFTFNLFAQTEYMVLAKKDGTTVNVKVADVDSVTFATFYGEQLGNYAEDNLAIDSYDMEINPVTKVPTFFLQSSGVPASVLELGATGFTNIGPKGITGVNSTSMLSLTFDANGVPYAYFLNTNKKSEVKKFTDGAWTTVGAEFGTLTSTGGATVTGSHDGIGVHANQPIVGFMSSQAIGATARRTLTVSYFDGVEWLADQNVAGVSAYNYLVNVFNANGILYCGFIQQGTGGSYKLYKYNGDFQWEKITEFLPAGASQPNILLNEWVVSKDGKEIYLLMASDAITNGVYFPTVFRYTVETQKWTQVGAPLPSAGGANNQSMQTASRQALSLDAAGNPMVFYKDYDNNYYPTIVTLNPETRQWNTPIVLESYSLGTKRIMLKSIEPGTQYASYTKTINGVLQLSVVKLNF